MISGTPAGHPLHLQYVERLCKWSDDEDLPGVRHGLDVGVARGAMYEVAAAAEEPDAANDHKAREQEH